MHHGGLTTFMYGFGNVFVAFEAKRSEGTEIFSPSFIALGDITERHRNDAIDIRGTGMIIINAAIFFRKTERNDAALLTVDFGTSMKASCVTES